MTIFEKLKILSENINKLKKLNEDLIESHSARASKIKTLENKIEELKTGIKESSLDIENYIKDLNAKN